MKCYLYLGILAATFITAGSLANAAERYVSPLGQHVPPFLDWSSAATNIQAAIDVAGSADTVWVTNGIYNKGGINLGAGFTNRVALTKALSVRSVNGPQFTVIEGFQTPGVTNGSQSVRCAWLTNGATLSGFTLARGATHVSGERHGGGAYCVSTNATLTNCWVLENSAAGSGGGVYQGLLLQCLVKDNSASEGGGTRDSYLLQCTVTANRATTGGGMHGGFARSCLIATNFATGVYGARAEACRLIGNQNNGAWGSQLQACFLQRNHPYGAMNSTNLNCTFLENSSATVLGRSTNCIMWFNGFSFSSDLRVNCLLQPGEDSGTAFNANNSPFFPNFLSDGVHLASDSPAIGRGANIGLSGTDLDGQPWTSPPSIGCDQWTPQPLLVAQPRIMPGNLPRQAILLADMAGQAPLCWWTRDGIPMVDSSRYSGAHTPRLSITDFDPADAGNYQVIASNNFGVVTSAVATIKVACVDVAGSTPQFPYDSWSKATPTIQQAVDSAEAGTVVLVSNGVYVTGGRALPNDMFNRVVLDKPITLLSVNGSDTTIIEGAFDPATTNGPASIRCAWIGNGGVFGGFTLRNGSSTNGGGVWCADRGVQETLINCRVTNCYAAQDGGGVYQGRLRDCVLTGNVAKRGGGAAMSVVEKSLIERNAANEGGGVWNTVARGCRILANDGAIRAGGGGGQSLLMSSLLALNTGGIGAGADGGGNSAYLYHCTVVSNRSPSFIGGVNFCSAYNSIIYFNKAEPHPIQDYARADLGGSASYYGICSPLTLNSAVTNNPQLLDLAHIAVNSPCVGAATNLGNIGYGDIDGEPWNASPSIGCDEPLPAGLTGPLSLTIYTWPEVAVRGVLPVNALISGRASHLQWDFGDGQVISNAGFNTTHTWTNPGDYTVKATVFNSDNPQGVSSQIVVHVIPLESPMLGSPYKTESSFSFQSAGLPGLIYELQAATNLAFPVFWQPLQTISSTGGMLSITAPVAPGQQHFYRLLIR
jgi:hypothetical protein